MKRRAVYGVLCFLLLGLVIWLPGAFAQVEASGGLGFGQRVAGTYVDQGEIGGGPFTGLQTLAVDGTHSSTNTNCCGLAGNLQGPGQGAWVRTGTRQVTLSAIIHIFDLDGFPLFVGKPTLVMDFDEDFNTATGTISTGLYLPDQDLDNDGILDYVDPDGVPFIGPIPGVDTWTRLDAE